MRLLSLLLGVFLFAMLALGAEANIIDVVAGVPGYFDPNRAGTFVAVLTLVWVVIAVVLILIGIFGNGKNVE